MCNVSPIVQYMLKIYGEQSCSQLKVSEFGFPSEGVSAQDSWKKLKKNMEKKEEQDKRKQKRGQIKKEVHSFYWRLENIYATAGRGK